MADTGIITQATFSELKLKLQLLAQSLSFHANGDLSGAHGINIVQTPATDGSGNPTDQFYDQNGDLVGPYHIGFVVNNTPFYAPAKLTTLAGNPTTTGITDVETDQFRQAGANAWITKFDTPLTSDLDIITTGQLIPHTLLDYHTAHGGVSSIVGTTYDSAGHLVGNNFIEITIGGGIYRIPVHTRKGGQPQGWHSFNFYVRESDVSRNSLRRRDDGSQSFRLYYQDGAGTLPRKVYLQVNNANDGSSDNWHEFPEAGGNFTPANGVQIVVNAYNIGHPATPFATFTGRVNNGSDSFILAGTFRVRVVADFGGLNQESFSRWCTVSGADGDGGDNNTSYNFNASLFGAYDYYL